MGVTFVLSGGANLGAAQVGMLLALDEAGIRPDRIVGTSAGAVNGAWLASEFPLEDLAEVWRGIRRSDIFPAAPVRAFFGFAGLRDHLVPNGSLRRLLERHVTFDRLEDAAVPFHVVTTDVLTGRDVRLDRGPSVDAVMASAAIPGVFPPIRVDGRLLMDGGVINNTPISHAVELGADTVWVLATGHACVLPKPPSSALAMALHGVNLAIHDRLALDVDRYSGDVDLRVVPPLCPVSLMPTDFSQSADLIERAHRHTKAWLTTPHVHDSPSSEAVALLSPGHAHAPGH
jgi:NTE family protein